MKCRLMGHSIRSLLFAKVPVYIPVSGMKRDNKNTYQVHEHIFGAMFYNKSLQINLLPNLLQCFNFLPPSYHTHMHTHTPFFNMRMIFSINYLPTSRLLITFANSLDSDQARQNIGPDLVSNYLTP